MSTEIIPATSVTDPALFTLVQRLADNKYWLGRRYAEWCTAAPTLESAVAAAAMSQDEIGHARSHYPLFRQFVGRDIEPEDIDEFHSVSWLDESFGGWVEFVATNFLLDTALTVVYEAAQDSSYDDLRNRARRILGEETIHWLHGLGWVKRLARESEHTRAALQEALARIWVETIMWFGPDDDAHLSELVGRGVLRSTPSQLREVFLGRINPILQATDLEQVADTLPWDRWDRVRFRLR